MMCLSIQSEQSPLRCNWLKNSDALIHFGSVGIGNLKPNSLLATKYLLM
jgi:hypothetical protein